MSAPLLSIPDVVEQLAAGSRATVYRLIHAGELDRVDIGTGSRPRTRVTAESVADYIERHKIAGRKTSRPTNATTRSRRAPARRGADVAA